MSKSKKEREEKDRRDCLKIILTIWLICLFTGSIVWLITGDIGYFVIIGIAVSVTVILFSGKFGL
jgi:fatty acid desaturase